jgi:hypothetical protein
VWEARPHPPAPPPPAAVTGQGYLEMTGYHGSLGRVLSGR